MQNGSKLSMKLGVLALTQSNRHHGGGARRQGAVLLCGASPPTLRAWGACECPPTPTGRSLGALLSSEEFLLASVVISGSQQLPDLRVMPCQLPGTPGPVTQEPLSPRPSILREDP